MASDTPKEATKYRTQILPVNAAEVKSLVNIPKSAILSILEDWDIQHPEIPSQDYTNILLCADALKTSDVPVAFPTETVYGLGADTRRSAAVQGIYRAKQRPSDNPHSNRGASP